MVAKAVIKTELIDKLNPQNLPVKIHQSRFFNHLLGAMLSYKGLAESLLERELYVKEAYFILSEANKQKISALAQEYKVPKNKVVKILLDEALRVMVS